MAARGNQETAFERIDEERVFQRQTDDEKPIVRTAWFLKPITKQAHQAVPIPKTPLLSELIPHNQQEWPTQVDFSSWNCPQTRWKEWFGKLSQHHEPVWKKAGIFDAIRSSTYEIRCNRNLVLGLSEFWCPETNTFVFPWGEASVTLEDVMILGGYAVIGDPVDDTLLIDNLKETVDEMNRCRSKLQRGKDNKVSHSAWIKYFMGVETKPEHEHVAFLSLWLSRYVFPTNSQPVVEKAMSHIAAKLSLGIKLALAPVVLANLYCNLTKLAKAAMAASHPHSIRLSGQFQLLQIWTFERFPDVVPAKKPPLLKPGEPRIARWSRVTNFSIKIPLVRSALRDPRNFQWRPYAADIENWQHPLYYTKNEKIVAKSSVLGEDNDELSFLRCLLPTELEGIDCKERYLPHRVANQFGMDQDLPAGYYDSDLNNRYVRFFIPSRSFQPGASVRYLNWWKDLMSSRSKVSTGAQNGDLQRSETLLNQGFGTNEECCDHGEKDDLNQHKEFSDAGKSKEIIYLTDDEDDDAPIAACMRSSPRDADCLSLNVGSEASAKGKRPLHEQGNEEAKMTAEEIAKKVKVESVGHESCKYKINATEVKKEPIDQVIDSHEENKEPYEVAPQTQEAKMAAAGSRNNPIDLDEDSKHLRKESREDLRTMVEVVVEEVIRKISQRDQKK